MSPHHYHTRAANMAFHNFCTTSNIPAGTPSLLGLNLKFCIEPPRPYQNITRSLFRFRRDTRLHYLHSRDEPENPTQQDFEEREKGNEGSYIPKLYIASTWNPKPTETHVEHTLDALDKAMNECQNKLPSTRRYNLSCAQRHTLSELRKRPDLIVLPTDKNLGPSVIERTRYINAMLSQHLLRQTTFEQINATDIYEALTKQQNNFTACYEKHREAIMYSDAQSTYFERAMTQEHLMKTRVPQLYGTPKAHKNMTPNNVPHFRPVQSCVNSLPEIFSKMVSHHLQHLVQNELPTYIRDSKHLRNSLLEKFPLGLPKGAKLFSIDAVSMYTNIETAHGIEVVRSWFTLYKEKLPPNTPAEFVIDALSLIMNDNILQFGNTYWRQKQGTAMGTSCAVNYANLYVGLLEVLKILPNFKNNLLFYMRFIDDGFGVWIDTPEQPNSWELFMATFNDWGVLKWTTTGRTNSVVFLDLTIKIQAKTKLLHFSSYAKEMNLHLYIPPTSAHPPGMIRGLVFGRLRHYWEQNTETSDFLHSSTNLMQYLVNRGHSRQNLLPIFLEITRRLEKRATTQISTTTNHDAELDYRQPVYFHLPYHPRGIQRQEIRRLYNSTIGPLLSNRRLVVAVSRQRNLRDRVCNTTLASIEGNNPTDFLL
jgi:hypothetical protein